MKKTLFVLSAFFLVASPVLAGGLEEAFLPADQGLTLNQKSQGVVFASDYLDEVVNEDQKPGLLRKFGDLASNTLNSGLNLVKAPLKVVGRIFDWNGPVSDAPETAKIEGPQTETWTKLDPSSMPDLTLKMKDYPGGYTVDEKSEGHRLANISTTEKQGLGNKILKVQILLQDIVSTDEK
jgi:hypothetical protein